MSSQTPVPWEEADLLTKCWRIGVGAVFFGGACLAGIVAGPGGEDPAPPVTETPKRKRKKVIIIYE